MDQKDERLNAEYAVAGAILIDGGAYRLIAGKTQPEDFASAPCAAIVRSARELTAQGKPVDPLTVQDMAKRMGQPLDNSFLASLMNATPTAANAEHYADMVHRSAMTRKVKALAQTVVEDGDSPPEELLSRLSGGAQKLIQGTGGNLCIGSDEMMGLFYQDLSARCAGEKNVVPSGYRELDRILGGGFLKGGLYIIAARPGMGKTTLALNLADSIPGGVLFVTLEMSANQLTAKRLARRTGIRANRLLMGDSLTDQESDHLARASACLAMSGMVINRVPGCSVAQIALMAAGVADLQAVVIDYLGLIRPENSKLSRYEAITQISGQLKQLAIRLNVPILCLCQLNRASETRDDRRPRLSDLRDSGAIEQDADGVLLLYREDYYEKGQDCSSLEVDIAKNRHAGTGKVRFTAALPLSILREEKP